MKLNSDLVITAINKLDPFCVIDQQGKYNTATPWLEMKGFKLIEFKLASHKSDNLLMIRRKGQKYEYPHISIYYKSIPKVFVTCGDKMVIESSHYSIRIENDDKKLPFNLLDSSSVEEMLRGVWNVNRIDGRAFLDSFLDGDQKIKVELNLSNSIDEPLLVKRGLSVFAQETDTGNCIVVSQVGEVHRTDLFVDPKLSCEVAFVSDCGSDGEEQIKDYVRKYFNPKIISRVNNLSEKVSKIGEIHSFDTILGNNDCTKQKNFFVGKSNGQMNLNRPIFEGEKICFTSIYTVKTDGSIEEERYWSPIQIDEPTFSENRGVEEFLPEIAFENFYVRLLISWF